MGAGWKVKLVLMKVKLDDRLEKIALSMAVLYRNRVAVSKVDVPKSLPNGHAVAANAVVVVAARAC